MKTCPRCGKETGQPFHTCKKMKTPQEEAEEMVDKTVNDIDQYFQNEANYRPEMKIHIQQNIPLPELIAVARAANGLSMGSDWNHGTHAKEYGYRQQLIDALQALRATRKVDGI